MFKILLIIMSLNGTGNGRIDSQVIGAYTDVNVCTSIAKQMTQVHKFPDNLEYNDFEVSAKCFQATDR